MDLIYIHDVLDWAIRRMPNITEEAIESCEKFIKMVDNCVEVGINDEKNRSK